MRKGFKIGVGFIAAHMLIGGIAAVVAAILEVAMERQTIMAEDEAIATARSREYVTDDKKDDQSGS